MEYNPVKQFKKLFLNMSNCPPGTEYDSNAPWNKTTDEELEKVSVTACVTIYTEAEIVVDKYKDLHSAFLSQCENFPEVKEPWYINDVEIWQT